MTESERLENELTLGTGEQQLHTGITDISDTEIQFVGEPPLTVPDQEWTHINFPLTELTEDETGHVEWYIQCLQGEATQHGMRAYYSSRGALVKEALPIVMPSPDGFLLDGTAVRKRWNTVRRGLKIGETLHPQTIAKVRSINDELRENFAVPVEDPDLGRLATQKSNLYDTLDRHQATDEQFRQWYPLMQRVQIDSGLLSDLASVLDAIGEDAYRFEYEPIDGVSKQIPVDWTPPHCRDDEDGGSNDG